MGYFVRDCLAKVVFGILFEEIPIKEDSVAIAARPNVATCARLVEENQRFVLGWCEILSCSFIEKMETFLNPFHSKSHKVCIVG